MAAEPTIALLNGARRAQETPPAALYATVCDYWALTKPEVNFLILITTFAGFYLASTISPGNFRSLLAFQTLLGTLLVAAGRRRLTRLLNAPLIGKCVGQRAGPWPLDGFGVHMLSSLEPHSRWVASHTFIWK